jgi:thiol-disulfide isomerase/thioredoxin
MSSCSNSNRWWTALVTLVALVGYTVAGVGADDPKKPDGKKPADKPASDKPAAEKPSTEKADRYELPAGDAAALVKFIEDLKKFRPTTRDELVAHFQKSPAAIKAAAEKILELEQDKGSDAVKKARGYLLEIRVQQMRSEKAEGQRQILAELKKHLAAKADHLEIADFSLAMTAATTLDFGGSTELAIDAYSSFGELFGKSTDKRIAETSAKFTGAVRRLKLPGKEIEIKGNTSTGDKFVWSKYRGKVVLVDYWATWCGPCRAELPNVKRLYAAYHDKGFDVVGISLDTKRDLLEKYVETEKLPWVSLYEDGAGWNHSMAQYYGVMSIPLAILVDKEGKVLSMNARGPELGKLLEKQLGPPSSSDGEKSDKPKE